MHQLHNPFRHRPQPQFAHTEVNMLDSVYIGFPPWNNTASADQVRLVLALHCPWAKVIMAGPNKDYPIIEVPRHMAASTIATLKQHGLTGQEGIA